MLATRPGSMPARKRFPLQSASRPTRSLDWACHRNRLEAYANAIPIGYAVTYIFGTIGSAIILAQLGPRLIGVDLAKACADYEREMGGGAVGNEPGILSAYRRFDVRAYRIEPGSYMLGKPVRDLLPDRRVFVERVRRDGLVIEADADTMLEAGDVVAISGRRELLVEEFHNRLPEVEDKELLDLPAEAVDVFVTNKAVNGKTLRQLSDRPFARGVYLRKITRNQVEIPILPGTEILRGDILSLVGSQRHVETAIKDLGYADRPVEASDIAFVGAGIVAGGLVGALSYKWGSIPISLSTSGGALLAGLILGYLRAVHPTFGRVPGPALWLMNTLGLNVFIAVVGINADRALLPVSTKRGFPFLSGASSRPRFRSSSPSCLGITCSGSTPRSSSGCAPVCAPRRLRSA